MFAKVLKDQFDLLFFRSFKPNLREFWHAYLIWGLVITWLTGVGRYWDHPNAQIWQYLGLGSVAYVFVLAFLIWAFAAPLKPAHWSYRNVLIFVTLTALPALLYAIPVERFMSLENAQTANVWFLALVALWRVALLFDFLRSAADLRISEAFVAGFLPLVLIVTALVALNLESSVFEIMAGMRDQTSNDGAYLALILINTVSIIASPVLLIWYVVLLVQKGRSTSTQE